MARLCSGCCLPAFVASIDMGIDHQFVMHVKFSLIFENDLSSKKNKFYIIILYYKTKKFVYIFILLSLLLSYCYI
jgi:hypothetical protein